MAKELEKALKSGNLFAIIHECLELDRNTSADIHRVLSEDEYNVLSNISSAYSNTYTETSNLIANKVSGMVEETIRDCAEEVWERMDDYQVLVDCLKEKGEHNASLSDFDRRLDLVKSQYQAIMQFNEYLFALINDDGSPQKLFIDSLNTVVGLCFRRNKIEQPEY